MRDSVKNYESDKKVHVFFSPIEFEYLSSVIGKAIIPESKNESENAYDPTAPSFRSNPIPINANAGLVRKA